MPFPIDDLLPSLLTTLSDHATVVLQAPPGAGKTTRVPPALLGANWLGGQRILMLEPRRLAARAAARFMASARGEAVGKTVGYRTRLDSKVSRETRIEVVTEGILTRLLQSDPELSGYGAVLFDEFHERSLQADLGLALLRESQQALREDLRLIVMSATLDSVAVAQLLDQAPILTSEGRQYPVAVHYRPPARQQRWQDRLLSVIQEALAAHRGSLLVFLPGVREIRATLDALQGALPDHVVVAPLYGDLPGEAQDLAIAPSPAGHRKIVLATAIAETSLTIDGIEVVIDAGWQRGPQFDPNAGMTRLTTSRVSAAAAEQRKGRAGRLGPGVCYRLWSESEQQGLAPFTPPEIRVSDLSSLVLELAQWGTRAPDDLIWLDPPPAAAWQQGAELLRELEALDGEGRITDHGRAMLGVGLPPRLAHLVVRGRALGFPRLAAELAALLSERDLLGPGRGADLHHRLLALRGEMTLPGGAGRLRQIRDMARRLGADRRDETIENVGTLGELLALAYPDRIAQRRPGKAPRYRLANGRGAVLADDDPLGDAPWLVVAELDGQAREARVFLAAVVDIAGIEATQAERIRERDLLSWDGSTRSVRASRRRELGALVLEEKPLPQPAPEQVLAVLLEALQSMGAEALPWEPAVRQWQARVMLMRSLEPDQWPDVGDQALMETLESWAGPFLAGMTRLDQVAKMPLQAALSALLDYPAQQRLAQAAPSHIEVPSGSRIAIDYLADQGPVLAVKLQEMFGLGESPRIADGRVALQIHLLSPARRPVAVTRDLASFWVQGYPQVRKELRGRYPKHPWPEDPWNAPAQRGTKRRSGH
ncbi:ATP-dependent helicase HrpB [Mangrovitalea sediminis]|uniref:ATP-dependent helicase HrpB n=1 Tax=Mangrovitalea sediminis TaxID=1982043 RepID=UPI000BE5C64B|nr:ATP-dependent helicase HrpB [Mangrovitalea sediminis]